MRFVDKITIVTGAGSGIGREIARQVHREGGQVAAFDVNERTVHALADDSGPSGPWPIVSTSATAS